MWTFDPGLIRQTRAALGLTPTAFGRRMGAISGAQIIDIEDGRRGLTIRTLLKMCNTFGIAPRRFFEAGKTRKKK